MSKDLEVFEIPTIEEDSLAEPGENKCEVPSKMVSPCDLHPVASWTRAELYEVLVTRFYGGVWDSSTPNPSFVRDAAVLLTPPFNGGRHLEALSLAETDIDSQAASSLTTPYR